MIHFNLGMLRKIPCAACGCDTVHRGLACIHCQPPGPRPPPTVTPVKPQRTHHHFFAFGRPRSLELTATEKRIVGLLGQGMTDPEMAAATGKNKHTIQSTLSRARDRLGLRTRVDLAEWARKHQAQQGAV